MHDAQPSEALSGLYGLKLASQTSPARRVGPGCRRSDACSNTPEAAYLERLAGTALIHSAHDQVTRPSQLHPVYLGNPGKDGG
jgi:hypothetical protein